MNNHPGWMALSRTAVSAAAAIVVATPAFSQDADSPRPKDDAIRIGTITISGGGDKLGAGQMLNEDAVKGRSTVTKQATEKDRASGNSYQALALLPGVNTYNHDATGLFGGGITVRGFGADQLGFTINGVPVNDSGSYSVFPQEYTDQENVCTQSLAQGNPDTESPHIGATGGSISITTCDPEDKFRLRLSQTLGELSMRRTFVRVDTGRFLDGKLKAFASYSHTTADKWKGEGRAERDHLDTAFSLDATPDVRIVGSLLYNRALNNNLLSMSLAQLNANGYDFDFATSFPGHAMPVNGTAQTDTAPSPAYYKLSTNPFENAIASVSASVRLADSTFLKVQPYFWYGYGTGGNQQRLQSETGFLDTTTNTVTAGVDLNGDGDTLDRVIVANSSVTRTRRPGITAEVNHQIGGHLLKFGLWYERAEHRQTGPMVTVGNDGTPADYWLRDGQVTRPDGTPFESRDWLTISPAKQLYVSDQLSLLNEQLAVVVAVRTPHITRKFTNTASEAGGNSLNAYTIEKRYSAVLPQVGARWSIDKRHQVFANIGKNFRAPPNFAFAPTNNNVVVTGGVPTLVGNIQPETSINFDGGYRYQTSVLSLSATAFNVDFKNRQSNAFDPGLQKSIYTNAGDVNNRGLEFEAGSAVFYGFSAYGSVTLQKSEIKSDIQVSSASGVLPTSGKEYPLTPKKMIGLSLQYENGPWYARLKVKNTGSQWATVMNDEQVPSYTTGDLDAGYKLPDMGSFKNLQLRLNVSNIADAKYRNPSSGAVVNAQPATGSNGTVPASGTVFYYLGAPRLTTLSFSADFN
jgi:iron complex outermembrane recepter protein